MVRFSLVFSLVSVVAASIMVDIHVVEENKLVAETGFELESSLDRLLAAVSNQLSKTHGFLSSPAEPFPSSCRRTLDGVLPADGLPVFTDRKSLVADEPWAEYFRQVYGTVPEEGYPICVSGFMGLYSSVVKAAGVDLGDALLKDQNCEKRGSVWPVDEADGRGKLGMYEIVHLAAWVEGDFLEPVPSKTWVEVVHGRANEVEEAWYHTFRGSAIWLWTGNTVSFSGDNAMDRVWMDTILGLPPHTVNRDGGVETFGKKVGINSAELWDRATELGMDTLQLLSSGPAYCHERVQIVDPKGKGSNSCGHPDADQTILKAGWRAEHKCKCNASNLVANCDGFGSSRVDGIHEM